MSPIQIALLLLAVAGVWAVVELALTLRKTRTVVDSLDKTVGDLNNTLAEAQPVVAKLDGAVDELTPALAQVEPLLKSSKTAVDALTSNLVEVEAVVRDISQVTGSVAEASNAVSSVTDSAAGAVQKLFNKVKAPAADADRKLATAAEVEQPTEHVLIGEAEDEAADGADTVANLEVVEHRLGFLVLLALRTDQQEVEHDKDQNHRHKLNGIVDDGRAGAHGFGRGSGVGRRGRGGSVSQQIHQSILHGERYILSFIG